MENHKILITDDDPRTSSTIVESFEKQGYDYYFYQSLDGETALRLAREKKPELILIDWELPGISGLEVVNSLKNDKATQDILAIMITGVMTSIDNLLSKSPDLTPSEIKLCTFLRLNLRTKEIAAITFQEPHSIRIARSHLRKKMGLSREDNLATHLMTL